MGTRARGEAVDHGSFLLEETSPVIYYDYGGVYLDICWVREYCSIEVPLDGMTGVMAVCLASYVIGLGLGREENIVYALSAMSTLY